MKIPTRVLAEPEVRISPNHGQKELYIKTDVGEFPRHALSKLLGMSPSGLYNRLKDGKWQRDGVLRPGRMRCALESLGTEDDYGNEEWRSLSGKSRSYNLCKLK